LVRDPQGQYDPQAFLSTDVDHTPEQILTWFVRCWRMEVTFEEARAHLGIETQRQWSDLAHERAADLCRCTGNDKALFVEELPFFNVESKP
jgi:hypothetical protein